MASQKPLPQFSKLGIQVSHALCVCVCLFSCWCLGLHSFFSNTLYYNNTTYIMLHVQMYVSDPIKAIVTCESCTSSQTENVVSKWKTLFPNNTKTRALYTLHCNLLPSLEYDNRIHSLKLSSTCTSTCVYVCVCVCVCV